MSTSNTQQVPSIARMVHYQEVTGLHCAAVITDVFEGTNDAQLFVMPPHAPTYRIVATMGDQPGTWHWPEYVPPRTVSNG